MTTNVKIQKYKVVDLIESYNVYVKLSSVDTIQKNIIFLMRQALVRYYYAPEIL